MIEWIVSSCVLILVIIGIRYLFRGNLSPRVQYALWGLVLLRLLIPVSFGSSSVSTANIPEVIEKQPAVQNVAEAVQTPIQVQSYEEAYSQVAQEYEARGQDVSSMKGTQLAVFEEEVREQMEGETPAQILKRIAVTVWIVGMAAVTVVFVVTNRRFRKQLWKNCRKLETEHALAVYAVQGLDTPCLFGLRYPAVYVTEKMLENPVAMNHAIAHEMTHYRHGDHVWSMLRGVCLVLHWYNPLVWWAAVLSQRDGEFACDEATILRLGEEERAAYGRTLIEMTCGKKANMLLSATTMTTGGIKERIRMIARKPKTAILTLAIILLIVLAIVCCTFTGARGTERKPFNLFDTSLFFEYHHNAEDSFSFGYNKWGRIVFLSGYEWNGQEDTMSITLPEEYNGIPVTRLGGFTGTGAPSPFDIIFSDAAKKQICPNAYEWFGASDFILFDDPNVVYLDFSIHINRSLRWIELSDMDRVNAANSNEEGQKVTNVYVKRVYFTCDEQNETFYAKNGRLYYRDENILVEDFIYWDQEIGENGTFVDAVPSQDLNSQIGVTPQEAVTVCDVADLAGKDVTYQPKWYVINSLNDPQYLAQVGKWIQRNLELNYDAVLKGEEGCYISIAQMPYFRIDDASCSTAFLCYLFTEDMEPAGKILFNDWDGKLVHNGPVMYESDSPKFNLSVMMENPDRKYILLTNGYDEMLLDEYNEGYALYGKTFTVEGDYFHALDWKTIAFSYNEITYPGDLLWIPLITSEMIHEAAGQGADALIPYLPYVDGADYERTYGHEEIFALLDMVKEWVVREPSPSRMKTAMTDIRWVDGAYADYYAIMLTDLFEVNKSVFARTCLNDLPEEDEQLILSFIAYDWGISVEQAKARLEAELE